MGHAWKGASVTRLMPTEESVDLMALVEDFAARELAPRAAQAEAEAEFPRDALRALGELGILGPARSTPPTGAGSSPTR